MARAITGQPLPDELTVRLARLQDDLLWLVDHRMSKFSECPYGAAYAMQRLTGAILDAFIQEANADKPKDKT